MSTIQDFKNAPVGATATGPIGVRALRLGEGGLPKWILSHGARRSSHELADAKFTLDHAPAPTTVQEALDLAWNLGHPIKEGRVITKGTKWMKKVAGNVREYTMRQDYTVTANDTYILRTHEPLPEPEPDWLDAPAVLAAADALSGQKVWLPRPDGHWECTCCGYVRHWSKMIDVNPLYPKEEK